MPDKIQITIRNRFNYGKTAYRIPEVFSFNSHS